MKPNTLGWLISSAFLALITALFVMVMYSPFKSALTAKNVRRDILALDHSNLIESCRYMIAHRDLYNTNTNPDSVQQQHDIYPARNNGLYGDNVPEIIRSLRPWNIEISTNRVYVLVQAPPRIGFIGYADGAEEHDLLKGIHATMLTNGLWMITN